MKKNKTCVIFHEVDLDGWMSAAIVKHWFENNKNKTNDDPLKSCSIYKNEGCSHVDGMLCNTKKCETLHGTLDFIGYNYGQPIPDLTEFDKIIMCDISFPKDEMIKLWDIVGVENMIWIDHHISAIKEIQDTKWLWEGQQDTKFAACELTWKYFFPNEEMPEIVRLLGLYDSFRHKNTDEEQKVLEFQYGARQCISNYEEAYKYLTIELNSYLPNPNNYDRGENPIYKIWNNGKSIYQYLCTEAKQSYKNGFEILFNIPDLVNNNTNPKPKIGECGICSKSTYERDIHGNVKSTLNNRNIAHLYHCDECLPEPLNIIKFICINKERFNPINFGIDYHKEGYDGAMCFHIDNNKTVCISLYNDNGEVDCSDIAKSFGGGGHRGAAGCRMRLEQFSKLIYG